MISSLYSLPNYLSETLDKPMEQSVYFVGSFAAIACAFILKEIHAEIPKKYFCVLTGSLINFYVFGMTAFASIF